MLRCIAYELSLFTMLGLTKQRNIAPQTQIASQYALCSLPATAASIGTSEFALIAWLSSRTR